MYRSTYTYEIFMQVFLFLMCVHVILADCEYIFYCLMFFFQIPFPPGVVAVAVSSDCSLYSLLLKVIPALAMGTMRTNMMVSLV